MFEALGVHGGPGNIKKGGLVFWILSKNFGGI